MKLTIPTDFSQELVQAIADVNSSAESSLKIGEAYGCLPVSIIGSLRPASTLPNVDIEGLRCHIDSLASIDVKFNYTLNSPWLSSLEATESGRKAIVSFLSEIVQAGVHRFTIALPFLARLVKARWPHISVSASIVANISDFHSLRHWKSYGIDRVVVPREKTRDFIYLRNLKKDYDLSVEVLASSPCLLGCPDTNYHGLVSSCQSQSREADYADVTNYGRLNCHRFALCNPEEFMKMPWIRPEDISLYARLGVEFLKIDGRDKHRDYNIFRARQYCREHYEGNWLHMLLPEYPRTRDEYIAAEPESQYLVYLDNRDLDGFVEATWGAGICMNSCSKCELCRQKASQVLQIDSRWREGLLERIEKEQSRFFLLDEEHNR